MARYARTLLTTFLLTPFYMVAVPIMLVFVLCDFAIFRATAYLGPKAREKSLWEY